MKGIGLNDFADFLNALAKGTVEKMLIIGAVIEFIVMYPIMLWFISQFTGISVNVIAQVPVLIAAAWEAFSLWNKTKRK